MLLNNSPTQLRHRPARGGSIIYRRLMNDVGRSQIRVKPLPGRSAVLITVGLMDDIRVHVKLCMRKLHLKCDRNALISSSSLMKFIVKFNFVVLFCYDSLTYAKS